MNKQDKLRKALLGRDLYNKCITNYGITEEEVESRFNEIFEDPTLKERLKKLDVNYKYLSKCSKSEFVKMCGLKDYDSSVKCLDDSDINTLYYDDYKENYYYDIVELDCSKKSDKNLLKKFQILEGQQYNEFTEYLSLREGCREDKNIFYVAFNSKYDEIGAVCKTTESDSYIEIDLLTTRAGKTKSPLYKGLGNLVLNYIVTKYNNTSNDKYVGILLTSDTNAVGFYEKYGFEKMQQEDLYFYKFDLYKKIDDLEYTGTDERSSKGSASLASDKFLENALDFALLFDDENLVIKLKDKGVIPLSSKRKRYLISSLALKYFMNELNITQEDFDNIVRKRMTFIIPLYIDYGFIMTEEQFYDLFKKTGVIMRSVEIIKSMIKQNYVFSEDLIFFIGESSYEKNIYEIFKLAIDIGFKIDRWMVRDIKGKKENVDKIYDLVLDNFKPTKVVN